MPKTEVVPWKEFMNGTYKKPTKLEVIVKHVERNKIVYRVAGATVILLLAVDVTAFADSAHDAVMTFASGGGMDAKASSLYNGKLMPFFKWAIIIKGGWTTVQKTIQEDFDGAKKAFFQYLLVYIFMLAFPWAMDQAGGIFT